MVNGKDTKTNDPPPPQWVNLNPRNSRARWSSVEIQQLQQGAFTSELEHMENPMFHHRKRKEIADVSGYFWVGFHVTKSSKRLSEKFMLSFVTYILIPSLVVQLFYTKLQLVQAEISLTSNKNVSQLTAAKKKKTSLLRFVWKAY